MKTIKRKLCAILCAILLAGVLFPTASAANFTDVAQGAWYYADVTRLAEIGVVSGVGNNKFEPARTVSNAEMIKMLVNAFFKDGYSAYEAANSDAMRAHFGDDSRWYSYLAYYAERINLLDGIHVTVENETDCNRAMTRYNMAMILYNVTKAKGLTVSEADKNAAQSAIIDYSSVPVAYRKAVKTCYVTGLINGKGDRGFCGGENMTRAEACAVIIRLDDLLKNSTNPVDPGPVVTPDPTPTPTPTPAPVTPEVPTEKDIATSKNAVNAWTIADNGNPDGYLNNGKPITEQNVLELLQKAETIWTHGTIWSNNTSTTGNNSYANPGNIMRNMLSAANTGSRLGNNPYNGCSGYAAMISDYIFGKSGNNFHRTTFANIRPGDVIVEISKSTGEISHVGVAISKPGGTYGQATTAVPGRIYSTDGNNSGKVSWPESWDMPFNETNNPNTTFQIYSRYPD